MHFFNKNLVKAKFTRVDFTKYSLFCKIFVMSGNFSFFHKFREIKVITSSEVTKELIDEIFFQREWISRIFIIWQKLYAIYIREFLHSEFTKYFKCEFKYKYIKMSLSTSLVCVFHVKINFYLNSDKTLCCGWTLFLLWL